MIRNLKALGLALVAVFAMSAFVASAASATSGTLTTFPSGKTVNITASQTAKTGEGSHEFTLTDHPVSGGFANTKCEYAHFDGKATVKDGATTMTVEPTYGTHAPLGNTCTAFGQPATITTTGCHYLLHTATKTPAGTGWHVVTDLTCEAGKAIKIVTGTCEVTVSPQTGLATSEVTNSGSASPETAMDLLLHTNITGIKYTVVKDNIGCPLSGTGSFSKGDYTGKTTVTATDSTTGVPVGITLH
jgi:hypothetical protein